MAKVPKAGWYNPGDSVPVGTKQWWTGGAWEQRFAPGPPTDSPTTPGWHRPFGEPHLRWWSGSEWSRARWSESGHTSVAEDIGQSIIVSTTLGGGDAHAIATIINTLKSTYPPCRIVSLNTYTSAVVAGTNVVVVVEWAGPSLTLDQP